MNAEEAMKEVEHLKFAVRVGLANSFRAFLRNISSEPSVNELMVLGKSRGVALQTLQRVISLSKLRADFRYLNRFDIPLATYLWVLSRTFPELARAGAEASAYVPRTWWTEQVCRYILGDWSQKPSTVTAVGLRKTSGDLAAVSTANVAASSSVFFSESSLNFDPARASSNANSTATQTYTNGGENEIPRLYTTQSTPKGRAKPK